MTEAPRQSRLAVLAFLCAFGCVFSGLWLVFFVGPFDDVGSNLWFMTHLGMAWLAAFGMLMLLVLVSYAFVRASGGRLRGGPFLVGAVAVLGVICLPILIAGFGQLIRRAAGP